MTGNSGRAVLVFFVALSGVLFVFACPRGGFSSPPQGSINVYFNHGTSDTYARSSPELANGNADLQDVIVRRIDRARSTIDVAVHELDLFDIVRALRRAEQRGVRIRCIFENEYTEPSFKELSEEAYLDLSDAARENYDRKRAELDLNDDGLISDAEKDSTIPMFLILDAFQKYGIDWIDDTEDGSKGSGRMHNKFAIFDAGETTDAWVLTGSTNWTQTGIFGDLDTVTGTLVTSGNANNMIEIRSYELGQIFLDQFEQMWGDGPGGEQDSKFGLKKKPSERKRVDVNGVRIDVQFSPHSTASFEETVNGSIVEQINQSQKSVHLAQFVFSDQTIANAIKEKWDLVEGFDVQGVFDPSFATRYYSEAMDMMGLEKEKSADSGPEEGNNPWDPPCQMIFEANLDYHGPEYQDKLHHKYAIIDQEVVITGSHNWSATANYENDENTLFIHSSSIANQYEQEFQARVSEARRSP